MKKFFNKTTRQWYTEGQNTTFRLSGNSLFSGFPTEEQLLSAGFEEVTPLTPIPAAEPPQVDMTGGGEVIEDLDPTTERMEEIKQQLKDMDYLTSKYIDGEDMSEYGDWQQERKNLREEYRQLERELNGLPSEEPEDEELPEDE